MAKTVQEVLQRAADRSKRRVELEVARDIVERNLGHQLADDEFGWLSVLSMPYFLEWWYIARMLSQNEPWYQIRI